MPLRRLLRINNFLSTLNARDFSFLAMSNAQNWGACYYEKIRSNVRLSARHFAPSTESSPGFRRPCHLTAKFAYLLDHSLCVYAPLHRHRTADNSAFLGKKFRQSGCVLGLGFSNSLCHKFWPVGGCAWISPCHLNRLYALYHPALLPLYGCRRCQTNRFHGGHTQSKYSHLGCGHSFS